MRQPMTLAQKNLARHAGLQEVVPGQIVFANVDLAFGNDITIPPAIKEITAAGCSAVFNRHRLKFFNDHYAPGKDIKSAEQLKMVRDFARKHGITCYEIGCGTQFGVEHALLPELGLAVPGSLIVGADSHSCTHGAFGAFATGVGSTDLAYAMATGQLWFMVPESVKFEINGRLSRWVSGKDIILHIIGMIGVDGALYRAMEFTGDTIRGLDMDDRMTICNMAIEAGGKTGIVAYDDITSKYFSDRSLSKEGFVIEESDPDASYAATYQLDAAQIVPTVACPPLPSNTKAARELGDVKIDQVVIGSCTNGRFSDLYDAALILNGHKVAKGVRLIVIPATQEVYRKAMHEGLLDIFDAAGAAISVPTCGPCLGGYMGILAAGERALATTNRNFVGRMGDPTSEVYLASPAVAAATAITGFITDPISVVSNEVAR